MGKKYISPENRSVDEILENINADFARWDQIYEHGCQDPFWPDGTNINLVRNHIIYGYRILAKKTEEAQLSLFDSAKITDLRPVPPELPNDWMCPTGDYPDRLFFRLFRRQSI